jgi:Ni,Fe-hydrogenase I cytochrome b subunit
MENDAPCMNTLTFICLKLVRWTGWLLLPLVLAFLTTGYAMSGRYGLSALTDEQTALTLHKLMHLPLGILLLVHVLPSVYLAFLRWGWIKQRQPAS